MVGPGRTFVTGPTPAPLPFGLLSASVVVEDPNTKLAAGVFYETLTCGQAHLTAEACLTGVGPDTSNDVIDDGTPYTHGESFTVYAIHRCRIPAGGWDSATRIARGKLASGEGRAVEEGFAAQYLTAAETADDPYPDLTPTAGTALAPIDAVATLEEWMGDVYGAVPVLHAARSTGTLLTNRAGVGASNDNGRLETGLGTIVAAGAGYLAASQEALGGVTPAAGERWLFVTGATMLRRGPVQTTDPMRLTDGTGAPLNEFGVFAHRTYVATAECVRARILVQSPVPGKVV